MLTEKEKIGCISSLIRPLQASGKDTTSFMPTWVSIPEHLHSAADSSAASCAAADTGSVVLASPWKRASGMGSCAAEGSANPAAAAKACVGAAETEEGR